MEHELFWQAVESNDRRFDGVFVLGVKTTGIYCKPSCRARLPKRVNVEFYDSPAQAEQVGFRACKRCRPSETTADPQTSAILKACRILDTDEPVSLNDLSDAVGLSSFHLQRSFKEIVGVSPKIYAEVKRMERFKDGMRNGSEVTTAMYDAGFGSSSRLYEKAGENLGMTPAVYGKGGTGMAISYAIAECELGKLLVARTPRGICSVTFGETDEKLLDGLSNEFPKAEIAEDSGELTADVQAIIDHLAGKSRRPVLPLDVQATAFQMEVWETLKKIPYGETRSYGEIAEQMGDKKKVRAVAQACAKNRVAVVIPCHRVIGSDGSLSGYRWGIERKRKLLAKEKTN